MHARELRPRSQMLVYLVSVCVYAHMVVQAPVLQCMLGLFVSTPAALFICRARVYLWVCAYGARLFARAREKEGSKNAEINIQRTA